MDEFQFKQFGAVVETNIQVDAFDGVDGECQITVDVISGAGGGSVDINGIWGTNGTAFETDVDFFVL